MNVLVINAGSSSLKYQLLDVDTREVYAKGNCERIGIEGSFIGHEEMGGEKQKLALARALYKNAPVVVLDEPTAALDALAESKLYGDFDKLIGNKTAVYISHRLSSTQFCDKVAMFKDGGIVEYGTHSELMDKGGEYADMFNVQAQYYIDNNESEVAVNA